MATHAHDITRVFGMLGNGRHATIQEMNDAIARQAIGEPPVEPTALAPQRKSQDQTRGKSVNSSASRVGIRRGLGHSGTPLEPLRPFPSSLSEA